MENLSGARESGRVVAHAERLPPRSVKADGLIDMKKLWSSQPSATACQTMRNHVHPFRE
jgi:hypothetical protein